jgi:hypothetical protein
LQIVALARHADGDPPDATRRSDSAPGLFF